LNIYNRISREITKSVEKEKDMNLTLVIIKSLLISVLTFGVLCMALKRVNMVKFPIIPVVLAYGLLETAVSLLHEVGHIVVARCWGLGYFWVNSFNMGVSTIPPISELPQFTRLTISLGGPLVSLVTVIVVWVALKYAKKPSTVLLLTSILFVQGLGSLADSLIFAQALPALTSISYDNALRVLFIFWTIVTFLILKRTMKSYRYLGLIS
jgi:hypothetical protein